MQIYRHPFNAMACVCEIVLAMDDLQQATSVAQMAIDEVHRVEYKYSRYRPDSILSQFNAAAGKEAILCDEETWALLEYADKLYYASEALFDITAGVLRRAWDFKTTRIPSDEELAALCQLVNWPLVERDDRHVRLPQGGMEIDFGGFGKEYAADRAGAVLFAQGVRHGYVNLGGDMRVIGPKPDGQPWMMGIQDPRHKDQLVATIPVERGGLATSGDYERFFEIDGHRYCHILNPQSGHPVSYWRTISVVAPLAVGAGSCTTIAMLKQSEGLEYLDSSGLSYLAVDQQGCIHVSKM